MSKRKETGVYTLAQVAAELECSERTVRREIKDGKLGKIHVRGELRVTVAQFNAYLRQREAEAGWIDPGGRGRAAA